MFIIKPLEKSDIALTKKFTDQWIGENYYSESELHEVLNFSQSLKMNASYLALDPKNGEVVGVRLSYAPGAWIGPKGKGISPEGWRVLPSKVAYFKSLFVKDDFQKLGVGKTLSMKSIETLKKMGAEAILCHSWLESPGNSSQLYLAKMGFEKVSEHPKFWHDIDYLCTRCAPHKCICTAMEMIKYLD